MAANFEQWPHVAAYDRRVCCQIIGSFEIGQEGLGHIFHSHSNNHSNEVEIYDVKSIGRTNEELWRCPTNSKSSINIYTIMHSSNYHISIYDFIDSACTSIMSIELILQIYFWQIRIAVQWLLHALCFMSSIQSAQFKFQIQVSVADKEFDWREFNSMASSVVTMI